MQKYLATGFEGERQPEFGTVTATWVYLASEADARIAELEKALMKFAEVAELADKRVCAMKIEDPMERRDLFMWQAQRRLCVADFNMARNVYRKL